MKAIFYTFQIVSVFILVTIFASAQTTKPEILSNSEKKESVKIAKLFEKRMNVGKDVSPILDELFVKDFISRYLQDKKNYSIPLIKHEVAEKFNVLDLRKYFTSTVNFEYLTGIYFLDKFYIGKDGDNPSFEESYPPGINTIVKTIHPQEEDETGSFRSPTIKTENELLSFIETQDKATKLVRDYLMKHPAMKTMTYRKNLKFLREKRSLYEPSATICKEDCFGFPSGTQLIRIDTVIYQLLLVCVDGKMRIINLASD